MKLCTIGFHILDNTVKIMNTIIKTVVVEVLIIDVLADVEIIVVGVIAIVLMSVLKVSYSVDVTSGEAFDLFVDAWMLDVRAGIALLLLAGVNANAIAVVTTALEFPVSTALKDFSR